MLLPHLPSTALGIKVNLKLPYKVVNENIKTRFVTCGLNMYLAP